MGNNDEDEIKIIKAFENPKYKWRTIGGVAKEIGTSQEAVKRIIDAQLNDIIKSSVPDKSGEELYTTRRHYRQKTSVLNRFVAAIKNRAD